MVDYWKQRYDQTQARHAKLRKVTVRPEREPWREAEMERLETIAMLAAGWNISYNRAMRGETETTNAERLSLHERRTSIIVVYDALCRHVEGKIEEWQAKQ